MVKVEKTYDVELKGTGRIDNIGKMTSDRVVTFKNLNLLPNEKLKKFTVVATDELSLFPWIQPLLPAGDSYHLIDVETYLPSPYAVASGYELKFLKMWSSADQPHSARVYMETQLIAVGVYTAGGVYNEQDIALPSTAYIDPDSSDPHVLTFNTGLFIGFIIGSVSFIISGIRIVVTKAGVVSYSTIVAIRYNSSFGNNNSYSAYYERHTPNDKPYE